MRHKAQTRDWMREPIGMELEDLFRRDPDVAGHLPRAERDVEEGRTSAFAAAQQLLD